MLVVPGVQSTAALTFRVAWPSHPPSGRTGPPVTRWAQRRPAFQQPGQLCSSSTLQLKVDDDGLYSGFGEPEKETGYFAPVSII